jgi:uncharacterized protein with NRDE domain
MGKWVKRVLVGNTHFTGVNFLYGNELKKWVLKTGERKRQKKVKGGQRVVMNETDEHEEAICVVNDFVEPGDLIHNELSRVKAVLDVLEHSDMEQLEAVTVPTLSFMMEEMVRRAQKYVGELHLTKCAK